MTTRPLSMFLFAALVATGCAADTTAPVGDDDGDGGDGGDGGDDLPVPLSAEGKYNVTSEFDLATNAPGTPGQIANYFIQATDDPEDPVKFMVDELIKALPDGSIKNFAQQSAPFIYGYLNDRLLEVAPDFVQKVIDVGDAFGQVTQHFGTVEVLEVNASGQATKTVTGLHFKIDNVDMDFPFADYGIAETKIDGLQVGLAQSGQITVSDHTVGLKYGQVLKLAIDQAVIPMIDPSAQTLEDILKGAVNCQAVGRYVFEALDFGSASTYESACNTGLRAASNAFYNALNQIDGAALEFALNGTARGVDRNGDGKMDEILTGAWNGTLGYAGTPAPLGTAKFYGKKM